MKPYTTHTRIYIITPYTPWCMASREPLWPHPVQHIRARAHTHAHTTNPFNLTFQFERCFVIVYLRPQGLLQKRWVAEDVRHFSGWEKNCFASICAFVSPASLLSSLFSCFPSSHNRNEGQPLISIRFVYRGGHFPSCVCVGLCFWIYYAAT